MNLLFLLRSSSAQPPLLPSLGIQSYTRFWGMTMFGCYCIINVTVLLNLLIAMMNHSYQIISVRIFQSLCLADPLSVCLPFCLASRVH